MHIKSHIGKLSIDHSSNIPVYKQLVRGFMELFEDGSYKEGDILPSMNDLSETLHISRETVKKSYAILREKGQIRSAHGKGFFVTRNVREETKVMMLFDKLSNYKFVLYHSFIKYAEPHIQSTIHLHNQDVERFASLLEENLENYDYFIITPHFPLDESIQSEVLRWIKKIPNRKLILLDKHVEKLHGQFGSVYQDFGSDVTIGLTRAQSMLNRYKQLHVVSSPASLYSPVIKESVKKYCKHHGLSYTFHEEVNEDYIQKGGVYLILNSQYDVELIGIIRSAKAKGLQIGTDIGILSYNESPVNEIILNGLSAISTDFEEMGRLAAEMVNTGKLHKIHNAFGFVARNTL